MKLKISLGNLRKEEASDVLKMINEGDFEMDYQIEKALHGDESKKEDPEKLNQHINTLINALVEVEDKTMRYDLAEILKEKINLQ